MTFRAGIDGITEDQALRWQRDPDGTRAEWDRRAPRYETSADVARAYPRLLFRCRGYRNPLVIQPFDDADANELGRALEELSALREVEAAVRRGDCAAAALARLDWVRRLHADGGSLGEQERRKRQADYDARTRSAGDEDRYHEAEEEP